MAIERLVETFVLTPQSYKEYNVQKRKITESDLKNLTPTSGNKLSESVQKYFEGHPVATLEGKTVWRVPISRYDWKNANGRIYEKKLWENVIQNQMESYKGNNGLADHPDDNKEGAFKEVSVVYLDMMLDESNKLVLADCVFVGDQGHKAEEIMEVGGRIGFSSSGFGELNEGDGCTVKWESYQLERPADLVLNPSQKVYGDISHKMKKESVDASIQESSESIQETVDTKKNQESTIMASESINSKMSKHEIRRFREDVVHYLGEISAKEDLQEKLNELIEIRSYFSPGVEPALLAEVDKQIEETKAAIDAAIKEHGKIAKTFGVASAEELKEGVKRLAVDTQFYERDVADWKKIAEGLQEKCKMLQGIISTRPTVEAYKTLMIEMKAIQETYETNKTGFVQHIASLKEKIVKQKKIETQMIEELESISSENTRLKEYATKLKEYGLRMKEKVLEYRAGEQAIHEAIEEKKLEEVQVKFRPSGNAKTSFQGFDEAEEVQEYYENLETRYGNDITPYKEKILSCKTVREAMLIFNKAFVATNRIEKISEALDPAERKALIEQSTGTKIRTMPKFDTRLPSTWE